jgi:hypothetical protein
MWFRDGEYYAVDALRATQAVRVIEESAESRVGRVGLERNRDPLRGFDCIGADARYSNDPVAGLTKKTFKGVDGWRALAGLDGRDVRLARLRARR